MGLKGSLPVKTLILSTFDHSGNNLRADISRRNTSFLLLGVKRPQANEKE